MGSSRARRRRRRRAPVGHSGTGYPAQGHAYFSVPGDQQHHHPQQQQQQQPSANEAGSRPTLPPATVFSAHIRQRSNPNPHQSTTPTHTQPSTAPGSQSSTAPVPSQPPHGSQRSHHFVAAPTPQRPGLPESFKSVQQLRPTFSPAIVRTPNHYRHDSQPVVPSPRVAPWDEASAGLTASANRHLSGVAPMVPSPRVLPWNAHARANGGSSPTPAPRNPQSSRGDSSRMYDTSSVRGRQTVQRSYSIPEPPRPAPVLRQNSMPVVQSDPEAHHPTRSSSTIPNLPQFAEEPGAVLSPLIGTVSESSESSASASTVVVSRSPPPLFIPPRYGPSPSPRRRRSRHAVSGSSSPSSSDSSDSDDNHSRRIYRSASGSRSTFSRHSGHSGHSGNSGNSARSSGNYGGAYPGAVPPALQPPHTPQGRSPASSTHTHRSSASSNPLPTPPQERRDPGFSLPPPQQRKPPPGTYYRTLRYGYWNRRGDHLTNDQGLQGPLWPLYQVRCRAQGAPREPAARGQATYIAL
ncbi:hypothetical protein H4582DRAFT_1076889 [Lactarius indigo]|nr:hypothetical protein H4582DRAFT_1076889 [Lactarius indigo]